MKVYLDTCSIQRPLDTPSQTRIKLEAEAVLAILGHVERGEMQLLSSSVLELDVSRTTVGIRREHGEQVLNRATVFVTIEETGTLRAQELVQQGIRPFDALHLAAAELAMADYFCTCDERLLRRARSLAHIRTNVVSPLELIEIIES